MLSAKQQPQRPPSFVNGHVMLKPGLLFPMHLRPSKISAKPFISFICFVDAVHDPTWTLCKNIQQFDSDKCRNNNSVHNKHLNSHMRMCFGILGERSHKPFRQIMRAVQKTNGSAQSGSLEDLRRICCMAAGR